jgi:pimeloyl-ACP methyl ester carboxylesterase
MALVHCDFFSDVLGLSTSMTVILPQSTSGQIGMSGEVSKGDTPVLYLLHGLSDDHTIWTRRTSIERYVAPLGLAVVMPRVDRSFYLDEAHGNRYWTFLSEELPEVVRGFFRVSRRREDTFVAGLSMGGYGAMKWALSEPHRFAAAASLSGAVDLAGLQGVDGWRPDVMDSVAGPSQARPTTCSTCCSNSIPTPLRRCRFPAAPRTCSSSRTGRSPMRCAPRDYRSPATSGPVNTSGATGMRGSRTCWPGCPSRIKTDHSRCPAGRSAITRRWPMESRRAPSAKIPNRSPVIWGDRQPGCVSFQPPHGIQPTCMRTVIDQLLCVILPSRNVGSNG